MSSTPLDCASTPESVTIPATLTCNRRGFWFCCPVNIDLIPYLFVIPVGEDGIYDNTVVHKQGLNGTVCRVLEGRRSDHRKTMRVDCFNAKFAASRCATR